MLHTVCIETFLQYDIIKNDTDGGSLFIIYGI